MSSIGIWTFRLRRIEMMVVTAHFHLCADGIYIVAATGERNLWSRPVNVMPPSESDGETLRDPKGNPIRQQSLANCSVRYRYTPTKPPPSWFKYTLLTIHNELLK